MHLDDKDPRNDCYKNTKSDDYLGLLAALVTDYRQTGAKAAGKSVLWRQVVAKMTEVKNDIELSQLDNDKKMKTWCQHCYERHVMGPLCKGTGKEEEIREEIKTFVDNEKDKEKITRSKLFEKLYQEYCYGELFDKDGQVKRENKALSREQVYNTASKIIKTEHGDVPGLQRK